MVGRIFPNNLIGLEGKGNYWFEDQQGLSYVLYLGNGGDSDVNEVDQNESKAVGGRFTAHFAGEHSSFETLDLSVSGYNGEDHSDKHETVLGLDTQIRLHQWEFLSEFAWGHQQVDIPDITTPPLQTTSDTHGYYLQLGYNFRPRWHTFYRFDDLDLYEYGAALLDAHQNTLGINFRPRSNISLKLELFEAETDRLDDPFYGIASAVVYNF